VVDERGEGEEAASRYGDNVAFALAPDPETLGAPPDDLAHVLANIAVAGPGVCALRALRRATAGADSLDRVRVRRAALGMAAGLRTLFNRPEIRSAIRAATH